MWNELITKKDVVLFNQELSFFHDSCLKELCFSTGGFVDEDLSMNVLSNPIARLVFQRQYKDISAFEMEFRDVIKINIQPVSENEGVDIIQTKLYYDGDVFFWSENDYEYSECDSCRRIWIAARKVRWKSLDNSMG